MVLVKMAVCPWMAVFGEFSALPQHAAWLGLMAVC
jgi:hypothetical protein